ncbi:MAG TPA: pyridoxal phosphate-dependent aminotransferase [Gemmatales bacterium]|nr:pyridoxal phosphate-dependent aminotransferase [Gemmatales bacterium]HMP59069.1 pyridoxal phosphate-dependent aminotransferase [Gemmatales bacterium]
MTAPSPRPARRLGEIRPSPIRVLSEGAPTDAIPLGLGEPTWELPATARAALADLPAVCAYGPNAGLTELRAAIADFHAAQPAEVMITCGSQGALFSLFLAWLEPGDVVLAPDPGFPAYPVLARLTGAEVRTYSLDAARGFALDPAALVATLHQTPKAKIVVINHPSNPTGGGADREALTVVAEACAAAGVLLISDEVYRDLYFGPRPPSLRDVWNGGVVLSSVSKGWGAPGLRVGWAVGPEAWLAPARTVHAFAVTAAALPSQYAALALLRASDSVLAAARLELIRRWDAVSSAALQHLGIPFDPPAGAFYLWLPLPPGVQDPMAFCLRLRDEGKVVVVPGATFGPAGAGHVRLSFAAQPGDLIEGLRRLAPYWRGQG